MLVRDAFHVTAEESITDCIVKPFFEMEIRCNFVFQGSFLDAQHSFMTFKKSLGIASWSIGMDLVNAFAVGSLDFVVRSI